MKYFCADPHFSRTGNNVLSRSFSSPFEMSEYILEKINSILLKGDTLYILGDFAFTFREVAFWRQRIKCDNIHIVRGNHDISLDNLKEIFGKYNAKERIETEIIGVHTVLDHYPMVFWNKSHYNSFQLYGHLHDMREGTIDLILPERRSMDCGFDVAKRILGDYIPFSETQIYELLSKKIGHDQVQWYIENRGKYSK